MTIPIVLVDDDEVDRYLVQRVIAIVHVVVFLRVYVSIDCKQHILQLFR